MKTSDTRTGCASLTARRRPEDLCLAAWKSEEMLMRIAPSICGRVPPRGLYDKLIHFRQACGQVRDRFAAAAKCCRIMALVRKFVNGPGSPGLFEQAVLAGQ